MNIWQSYKQERGCLVHFVRLATTLLKDEVWKIVALAQIVKKMYRGKTLHVGTFRQRQLADVGECDVCRNQN